MRSHGRHGRHGSREGLYVSLGGTPYSVRGMKVALHFRRQACAGRGGPVRSSQVFLGTGRNALRHVQVMMCKRVAGPTPRQP